MHEGRRGRAEHGEQRPLEKATDPRELDQHDREHRREGLYEHVAGADVRELVGDHAFELRRWQRHEQPRADRERGAARTAPCHERPREAVVDQVQLRRQDPELRREHVHGRAKPWILGERELAGAEHPEQGAIGVRIHGRRREQRAEDEERRSPVAADRPADRAERTRTGSGRAATPCPSSWRLRAASTSCRRGVALVVAEPAGRPVGLGRVAAAGAMQRGDVLERHEDVAVQLDVGDVLDRAVRGEHALLILAAEERDLDLLALVLVRVVLHRLSLSA